MSEATPCSTARWGTGTSPNAQALAYALREVKKTMKVQKLTNYLNQFDKPETLVVISLYPKKGETYSSGTSGIASYSKNVVDSMNRRVLVFADYQKQPEFYLEENALVLKIFKKNTKRMWAVLLSQLAKLKQAKKILIQFDFLMYGNLINSALIIPFLLALKILGFDVAIVSHSVVTDVSKLSGHVGLGKGLQAIIKTTIYNSIFKTFYWMLNFLVDHLIVLEDQLADKLRSIVQPEKLVSIPHAVDTTLNRPSKKLARKRLNISPTDQVILFFGFVNWFKGADIFAKAFNKTSKLLGKNTKFIIAGGKSATLGETEYYKEYFAQTLDTVYSSKNVQITGFVPQIQIKDYFAAADLVVFPYRYFMCASGVLSLVFSYQKPFIISKPLSAMLKSQDFVDALKIAKLKAEDVLFDLTERSLKSKTTQVLRNGLKKKLSSLSGEMRKQRSFANKALQYEQLLFENGLMTQPSILGRLKSAFSNVTSQ